MFSKKKNSTSSLTNASAYLAAVADRDRRAKSSSHHAPIVASSAASISTASTPALSLSSSITGDTASDDTRIAPTGHFDLDDALDMDDDDAGLIRPPVPPTSEQVFTTRHVEFGHCARPQYRHTSTYNSEKAAENHEAREPPYYILLTTYLSYLIFIVIGHLRDFFGKRLTPQKYRHLMPNNGFAALNSDFDSFYTRRLKLRIDDIFSRPVTGVAGRTIVLLDRKSVDYNNTFQLTGTRTRALNISSYNYLGFAQARGGCADAVEEGIRRYGVSACGPRLEGGTTDLHLQAEALVAKFVGCEDACIVSMGFATNSTTIPAMAGKGTLVISDEFNHASIRVGVRLAGASVRTFKHNDVSDLEAVLREVISQGQPRTHRPWKKILVIVEGLYSMEGTLVDLPRIVKLKQKYKFYLYIDEAHSIGAMGAHGRGVIDYFGIDPQQIDLLMGTFTKSFGASGGYVAGSKEIISRLRISTHSGPYAESMSPAVLTQVIASMASIMGVSSEITTSETFPSPAPRSVLPAWLYDQLTPTLRDGSEGRDRLRRLAFNARYLSRGLEKLGLIVFGHPDSPIIPVLLFNPGKMVVFSRMMLERKTPIVVVVVGYPATPLVSSRVRFCMSAAHTKDDVDTVLRACDEAGDLLDLKHGIPVAERWTIDQILARSMELVEMQ